VRLPRYLAYKNSGREWLGHVPSRWKVMPIRLAARLESGHTPSRSRPDWWEDCTVPWFTLADVSQIRQGGLDVIFDTKEKVSELGLLNSSARRLPPGTVMLSRTASVGFAAIMGVEMATTQDFANWVCGPSLRPRFLLQVFRAMQGEFARLMMGSTHNTIYMPDIAGLRFALPPLEEQDAIVEFVAGETAKIDALIAEQEKLIALLAEKRQATISRAVTRGLNPDVPMKDSGVMWLGRVPAHWSVLRIKHLVRTIEQGWSPQCEGQPVDDAEQWGVLKVGCVNGGQFDPTENKRLPENLEPLPNYALLTDDLLVSRANTRELVGSAAVVGRDFPRLLLCDKLYRLRLRMDLCRPDFLAAFLGSSRVRSQIQIEATGASSSMLNIGQAAVLNLMVALPPVGEQQAIGTDIKEQTAHMSKLEADATRAIALLRERRSALITAAVTGQIDVRDAVGQAQDQPQPIGETGAP
jgi:type I restriction enzyme S subunit